VLRARNVVFEGCSVDGGNVVFVMLEWAVGLRKCEEEWVVHNLFYDVLL
jgi:hypothetical protein